MNDSITFLAKLQPHSLLREKDPTRQKVDHEYISHKTQSVKNKVREYLTNINPTSTLDRIIHNPVVKLLKDVRDRARAKHASSTYHTLRNHLYDVFTIMGKEFLVLLFMMDNKQFVESIGSQQVLTQIEVDGLYEKISHQYEVLEAGDLTDQAMKDIDDDILEESQIVSLTYGYYLLTPWKEVYPAASKLGTLGNVPFVFSDCLQAIDVCINPETNESLQKFVKADAYRNLIRTLVNWMELQMFLCPIFDGYFLNKILGKLRLLPPLSKMNKQIVKETVVNAFLNRSRRASPTAQIAKALEKVNTPLPRIAEIISTMNQQMISFDSTMEQVLSLFFSHLTEEDIVSGKGSRAIEAKLEKIIETITKVAKIWIGSSVRSINEVCDIYTQCTKDSLTYISDEGASLTKKDGNINYLAVQTLRQILDITTNRKSAKLVNTAGEGLFDKKMNSENDKQWSSLPFHWTTEFTTPYPSSNLKHQSITVNNKYQDIFKKMFPEETNNAWQLKLKVQNNEEFNLFVKQLVQQSCEKLTHRHLKSVPKQASSRDLMAFSNTLIDVTQVEQAQSQLTVHDDQNSQIQMEQLAQMLYEKLSEIQKSGIDQLVNHSKYNRIKSYETMILITIQTVALINSTARLRTKAVYVEAQLYPQLPDLFENETTKMQSVASKLESNVLKKSITTLQSFIREYLAQSFPQEDFRRVIQKLVYNIPTYSSEIALKLAQIMASSELEDVEQQMTSTTQYVLQQAPYITDFEQGLDMNMTKGWDKECIQIYIEHAIPLVKEALYPYIKVMVTGDKLDDTEKEILKKYYYQQEVTNSFWNSVKNQPPLMNVFTCQNGMEEQFQEGAINNGGGWLSSMRNHFMKCLLFLKQVAQTVQSLPPI